MQIVYTERDNRNGNVKEMVWEEDISDDLVAVMAVADIIKHQRWRENVQESTLKGRFTTLDVRIVL